MMSTWGRGLGEGAVLAPLSQSFGDAEIELCSTAEAATLLSQPDSLLEWLADDERAALAALKAPKRQRDWLAARLAAKRLLRRRLAAQGEYWASRAIRILSAPSRQPFVALGASGEPTARLPISLSHGGGYGGCALGEPGTRLGLDLERIEDRDPRWRDLMADPSELAPDIASSAEGLTRLWTAKEAVLKLLGLGLTVDLRTVRPRPDGAVELTGASHQRWVKMGQPAITIQYRREQGLCLALALSCYQEDAHGD